MTPLKYPIYYIKTLLMQPTWSIKTLLKGYNTQYFFPVILCVVSQVLISPISIRFTTPLIIRSNQSFIYYNYS